MFIGRTKGEGAVKKPTRKLPSHRNGVPTICAEVTNSVALLMKKLKKHGDVGKLHEASKRWNREAPDVYAPVSREQLALMCKAKGRTDMGFVMSLIRWIRENYVGHESEVQKFKEMVEEQDGRK
jgi:hypothetical protein